MVDDEMRGEWKNRKKATRLHSFRGMKWGKITPTDVDMFIDFQNTHFVFGEGKTVGTAWDTGQRLALERAVDACAKGGRRALLLLWEEPKGNAEVVVKNQIVKESYRNGQWNGHGYTGLRVLEAINKFKNEGYKPKNPQQTAVDDDVLRLMGYDV